MKLIIQIPCLNEEQTLPQTLRDLPNSIPGIDVIEVLVIDDGSTDRTAVVARECGVDHILRLETRRGLAQAFAQGIEKAVSLGADIVVNTDGDNQYVGTDIVRLVQPILNRQADVVVGCRPILDHQEFSRFKKLLQLLGSYTLRSLSATTVRDAASGFRAFSREACLRLFVSSKFSYCMETLIQAGNSNLRVASADIRVNSMTRPSRLFGSTFEYVRKSGWTILTMFVRYRPGRFFGILASLMLAAAAGLGLRFLYLVYLTSHPEPERTYLPSLILLSILTVAGGFLLALGVLAELIKTQRTMTEETLYRLRKAEQSNVQPEGPSRPL